MPLNNLPASSLSVPGITEIAQNGALVSNSNAFPVAIISGGSGSGGVGTTGTPNVSQIVDGTTTTQKVSVSSAGALKTDGSGVTQPVTGSVTVTNFPGTQAVSNAALTSLASAFDGSGNVKVNVVTGGSSGSSSSTGATATVASVSSSTTAVTLLASNSTRKTLGIYNNSSANLYISYVANPTTSVFTSKLSPGGYFEPAISAYTGAVYGIWDAVNGNACVTEISP